MPVSGEDVLKLLAEKDRPVWIYIPERDKVFCATDAYIGEPRPGYGTSVVIEVEEYEPELRSLATVIKEAYESMKPLKDVERVEFISQLTQYFCQHCGREKPSGHYCQCNNDE